MKDYKRNKKNNREYLANKTDENNINISKKSKALSSNILY